MLEKDIERKLKTEVKKRGGLCLKFVSPSVIGVPDRIVMLDCGKLAFVELKVKGEKPRPIQAKRIEQIRNLGFHVYVIDSIEMIGGVLSEIQAL